MNQKLIIHVKAMAEIYGKTMTDAAAIMFLKALSNLPEVALMSSLDRCIKELRTFPTVAEVLIRAQALDGRPGPEEAWAMLPKSEDATVVWTEEMASAYGVCCSLIGEDDVAARMSFKEAYNERIRRARDMNIPTKWTASLGHSPNERVAVIEEAVRLGRLPVEQAKKMLPDMTAINPEMKKIIGRIFKS